MSAGWIEGAVEDLATAPANITSGAYNVVGIGYVRGPTAECGPPGIRRL